MLTYHVGLESRLESQRYCKWICIFPWRDANDFVAIYSRGGACAGPEHRPNLPF